jgi:flavin reductase (DIM6/NTAB) family NADH-FMN oxidoreductase RutF
MTTSFDDLMGVMDGALVVVTTAVDDQLGGCLIGFHSQCSIDPPRYALWLSRANHTYRVAVFATHFAVHVLGPDDEEVAEHWGTLSGDTTDKFADVGWTRGPGDVPLLDACPRRFVARRLTMLDDGSDHVCFVVEPVEARGETDRPPLRLSAMDGVEPGHPAQDRPVPDLEAPQH